MNDVKKTDSGLEIDLKLKDTAKTTFKKAQQIEDLKLEVTCVTNRILRLKIVDPKHKRFEVPFQKNFPLLQNVKKCEEKNWFYSLEMSESKDDFSFSVIRKSTKTKL